MTPRLAFSSSFVAAALVLSACGSGSGGSGSGGVSAGGTSKAGTTKISVANLGVTNSAGLVVAKEKGYFTEAGLDVEIKDTPAASTVPAVVSGGAQFAFTGIPVLINARANGLPVKAVAPAAGFPTDLKKSQIQLVAPQGSALKSAKDVEGKKVAVDTLYQLPHLSLIQGLTSQGIDAAKVTFVEIPYPSMIDAMKQGKVDAADLGDPFLSQALAGGGVSLLSNGTGFDPGVTQVIWIASEKYIAENPAVVKAFAGAVTRGNEYAKAHPDEVRKVVPTYMKGTESIAASLLLPEYTTTIDPKVFEVYGKIMTDRGLIKKNVTAADAVYTS